MPDKKSGHLEKVLKTRDLVALAFGAAIGWGWVVLSGDWLQTGGTLGAILGFVIGGVMVLFVGMTYSELCPAMPNCGGEHVFSLRALGYNWSFVCSWALALSYLGVAAFEACALPNVLEHIIPNFSQGYLYTLADMDIYMSYIVVGVLSALVLTAANYIGIQFASWLQQLLSLAILVVGGVLILAAFSAGDSANTQPLFTNGASGMLTVAVTTPFLMVGFDVIPQAAEEVDVSPKRLGHLMLFSIVLTTLWYCIIIFSVSMLMDHESTATSTLCTADALTRGWNGSVFAKYVVVLGGVCGILSSWNAFIAAGSRVLFSMANSGMLPHWFAKLHPKHNTPSNAVLFIGLTSCIAPFFGKGLMTWISNAASLSTVIAYGLVAVSFLVLRKKEPDMPRPYKIRHAKLVGTIAVVLTAGMLALYLPGMPSGLGKPEWIIIAAWTILGLSMYLCVRGRSEIYMEQKKRRG